ncbi:MAG: double-strand break repair helicase AddA, partial [Caulobacteraceae bacterium]|nr:double-strand break repair helicase AddA [Caulobacter sp.]
MSDVFPAVPSDTLTRQHRASDPMSSAWVSANAGSGKTHVLTQRVVRLLLRGVAPSRILCLTFTKAAAANMSIRVFDTLAAWTQLDDAALTEAIVKTGAPRPSPTDLALARKLFARTVETPGGLKIQTIHAFCERLLHLFPFEANVAARFEVLDDLRQAELLEAARADCIAQAVAVPEGALGRAVAFLAREASSFTFEALVGEALGHRDTLQTALLLGDTLASFGPGLKRALGLQARDTLATVEQAMLDGGLRREDWAAVAQRLGADGGAKDSAANRLARAALATGEAALEAYLDVFLTKTRTPRDGKYLVQALRKAEPDLCDALDRERDRLVAALDNRRAAETFERTLALVTVAKGVLDGYEAAKRRRGLLDFDDLVERTRTLLSRTSAAWVLYKLDAGIDHVLIDEAQDTSPVQWQILGALTGDFFSGAGAGDRHRTVFAVGDEKQSIYSFQGAEPAQFAVQREAFGKAARQGGGRFEAVTLNLSFRSTRAVLETVDGVFAAGDHAEGLSEPGLKPPPHEALRSRTPGLVELWPLVGPTPQPDPIDWRLPLDQLDPRSPPVTLAQRIADRIHAMLAPSSEETVEDRRERARRRIRPGDVLILVRSRNAIFDAVIRALKDRHVPVAGADRLDLTEHIAVMDLMAAGRAALLPDDDLTVASVLKSPLIGLDDDDLIRLAPERRGSLMSALDASPEPRHRHAAATLHDWRRRAAAETPFGFYARLLGPDGGRRAMLARLGQEAGDAVDEFVALALAHERDGPPSLTRFLAGLEGRSLSVKRDMEASGDAVRVMTVHAAKGLEAKIVFLPDTCGAPAGRHDPALFGLAEGGRPLLAWSPKR